MKAGPPRGALVALVALQGVCALVVLGDLAVSVLALPVRPLDWRLREALEIGAALGLLLGTALGMILLRRADARRRAAEDRARIASDAFHDLVGERFAQWALTPAERDVALFSLKGCTLSEIAALRGTSEGTVKAQSAAIYRKAGVANRAQLLGLFVAELLDEALVPEPAPPLRAVG